MIHNVKEKTGSFTRLKGKKNHSFPVKNDFWEKKKCSGISNVGQKNLNSLLEVLRSIASSRANDKRAREERRRHAVNK